MQWIFLSCAHRSVSGTANPCKCSNILRWRKTIALRFLADRKSLFWPAWVLPKFIFVSWSSWTNKLARVNLGRSFVCNFFKFSQAKMESWHQSWQIVPRHLSLGLILVVEAFHLSPYRVVRRSQALYPIKTKIGIKIWRKKNAHLGPKTTPDASFGPFLVVESFNLSPYGVFRRLQVVYTTWININ